MENKTIKKQFALAQIVPYVKDKSLCARDEQGKCQYLTYDGKMCVAGKNMLNPELFKGNTTSIESLIGRSGQQILKPESRDILTPSEWGYLQNMHDNIAGSSTFNGLPILCEKLGLFTYKEMMEAGNLLDGVEHKNF